MNTLIKPDENILKEEEEEEDDHDHYEVSSDEEDVRDSMVDEDRPPIKGQQRAEDEWREWD